LELNTREGHYEAFVDSQHGSFGQLGVEAERRGTRGRSNLCLREQQQRRGQTGCPKYDLQKQGDVGRLDQLARKAP